MKTASARRAQYTNTRPFTQNAVQIFDEFVVDYTTLARLFAINTLDNADGSKEISLEARSNGWLITC